MPRTPNGFDRLAWGAGSVLFVTLLPRGARAQPPDPALLVRLAHHADALAEIVQRGSYRLDQVMEEIDGDGKVTRSETTRAHVDFNGQRPHETVDACTRDGKDATSDKQRAVQAKEESKDDDANPFLTCAGLHMPFLTREQSLYAFDVVKIDGLRVEISFTPHKPDERTMQGAAWVDVPSGTVLSAGAKLSKPSGHIDWLQFTAEFGATTPLGPAVSRVTFEAKGGFLFVHKHVRGEMKLGDYGSRARRRAESERRRARRFSARAPRTPRGRRRSGSSRTARARGAGGSG